MKVADLEKGMLLEGIGTVKLCVLPSTVTWGPGTPMLQTVWPSKYDKNKHFVKCAMYLGTREELNIEKSFHGRRYALVEGQTMIVDREAWRYLQPVKEKNNGITI